MAHCDKAITLNNVDLSAKVCCDIGLKSPLEVPKVSIHEISLKIMLLGLQSHILEVTKLTCKYTCISFVVNQYIHIA